MNTQTSSTESRKVLALCGGVGGAKLALGLQEYLPPNELTVVVNTGDDFEHMGLPICPDLDTVMYTLAGVANPDQGWGINNESWQVMKSLEALNGSTWFQLGDKDLATHLRRRELLDSKNSLTATTQVLCREFGIQPKLLPMSDQPVRTHIKTSEGSLAFQHYFVKLRCAPQAIDFEYQGIDKAQPQADWLSLMADESLSAIVICPSNPFVSIAPMLCIEGVPEALAASPAPVIAVSPIVSGQAIKGPTAKMMAELGIPSSAKQVLDYYQSEFGNIIDGYLIDRSDEDTLVDFGTTTTVETANIVMNNTEDKIGLARDVLDFAQRLRNTS